MTTTSARSICARITQRLAESVGPRRYSIWFDRTAKFAYDDQHRRLDVAVPNRFVAEWIGRNFGESLRHAAHHEVGQEIDLRVNIHPEMFKDSVPSAAPEAPAVASPPSHAHAPRRHRYGSPHASGEGVGAFRHRLEDFIVGPSNELALTGAVRLAEEEPGTAHTLFLHGGCGLGKTHLLQGICARVLERNPRARVLYTTAEQFTNEFLVAMRGNRIEGFRKRIRSLDLLAVDDVHFLANKQATQQEFLHSFDAIELGGARVVLASDSHPKLISQFSAALTSRCVRGMVAQIATPDTATRVHIIRALALRRGIPLMDTVVEVIAARCVGSVRELEGTLAKLHALASLSQQRGGRAGSGPIEADKASAMTDAGQGPGGPSSTSHIPHPTSHILEPIGHTLINHLFDSQQPPTPRRAVRLEHVLDAVMEVMHVSRGDVAGGSRQQRVVLARSLVAYLARQMTPLSYPEIAAALGRHTHSTIITAAQRLEKQLGDNPTIVLPVTMEEVPLSDLVKRLKLTIARA